MSEVDWSKAPEWADRVMGIKSYRYWCNVSRYAQFNFYSRSGEYSIFMIGETTIGDMELIEMRPDEWKKVEERMEQIATNGGEGEHYTEVDNVNNPEHYQTDTGIECIDAIRAALGKEGFIAYCRGNAIKYNWRSGSKANHAEDLNKGAWYSKRAATEMEQEK